MRRWRERASSIPDPTLRTEALGSLKHKRGNTEGAALFWILPTDRAPRLLGLLVAYEIMADFLDGVNEISATAGVRNGRRLHLALIQALTPTLSPADYYHHNPARDDGGYLHTLVNTCREQYTLLPSHARVHPRIARAADLTQVLAINHELDPELRDAMLRAWAEKEFPENRELNWFESAAGASAWLTILALLALATERACDEDYITNTYSAYLTWISQTGTMLDSYGDILKDALCYEHSYIAHYSTGEVAAQRMCYLVKHSMREARLLRNGHKHAVIVACMVAMYLSKQSVRSPTLHATTRRITDAGGPLAKLLVPVLRAWRAAYSQRNA